VRTIGRRWLARAREAPAVNASGLVGQTCVVTGASSGIGRELALALASAGATVCAVGRRKDALEETAEAGGRGRFAIYLADLAAGDEVARLAGELAARPGGLDALVHSAGAISLASLETADVNDFDRQYLTNVRAPYLMTQKLLPALRTSKGQVVFINSSVGLAARAKASQFAATQHALKAIADSLRHEVNADGIRVLSVYPGRTSTPRQARIHEAEGKQYLPERLMQPADIASVVLNALLLPRSAELTDLQIRPMLGPDGDAALP
jgi:NADP-dependent 3-hydroxy acid dehydrogenase YdfG